MPALRLSDAGLGDRSPGPQAAPRRKAEGVVKCPSDCQCGRHPTGHQIEKQCLTCSKLFKVHPSGMDRIYCSMHCYDKTGSKNPSWKGGKPLGTEGRPLIYAPENPHATSNGGIYAYEYRIIAANKIGRSLTSEEVVHHIDGDVTNNEPENLQVMSRAEHSSLHSIERLRSRSRDSKGRFISDNNHVA